MRKSIIYSLIACIFIPTSFATDFLRGGIQVPLMKEVMLKLGESSSTHLDGENIKVFTWNMYKGDKPNWEADFKKIAYDSDILVLQEMYLDEKMARTFENHIGHEYHTSTSFVYTDPGVRTGLATSSHVKAKDVFFQRSKVREPIINTPKMALFTTYPIANYGKKLLVVNIHAINFVTVIGLSRQIGDIVKVLEKYQGPIIFAGDFNTWSAAKQYYMAGVLKKLKMKSVTFKEDTRMRVFGRIIDFVFYKGLTVKSSKIWTEADGSDHKAMGVTFKVN